MIVKNLILCLFLCFAFEIFSQEEKKQFFFDTGELSSEGIIVNGQPEGVWTSYFRNGTVKSIGTWESGKLDSLWLFYTEDGIPESEIYYVDGLKHGWYKKFNKEGFLVSKEKYVRDKRAGYSYYYKDNRLSEKTKFKGDKEHGKSYLYDEEGLVIGINTYKNGFINRREKINRKNKEGNKTGMWVEFFPCDEPCSIEFRVKWSGRFKNGVKNGIFREYDIKGELLSSTNYVDGKVVDNVASEFQTESKEEKYPNGNVKSQLNFRNGRQHGVSKYFKEDGSVDKVEIYEYGTKLGEGKLDEKGIKNGPWKEYYSTGELRAEGTYKGGLRVGVWVFYHLNGKVEQKGKYDAAGRPSGDWKWYYDNGAVQREESFYAGKEEGTLIEYNDTGRVISQGEYLDGEREGEWFYQMGDYREEGKYQGGQRVGEWKHYYLSNDEVSFKGSYEDGIPNGKHIYYFPSGKKMLEGKYEFGNKHGEWKRYNDIGEITLTIFYKDGIEVKVNNVKIKPKDDGT
ncbi:MAG: hypothetical protein MRY83_02735 [Flavobacteriales bacterium]|nr:hypothetical protein [Flavobacteriales bacterium]